MQFLKFFFIFGLFFIVTSTGDKIRNLGNLPFFDSHYTTSTMHDRYRNNYKQFTGLEEKFPEFENTSHVALKRALENVYLFLLKEDSMTSTRPTKNLYIDVGTGTSGSVLHKVLSGLVNDRVDFFCIDADPLLKDDYNTYFSEENIKTAAPVFSGHFGHYAIGDKDNEIETFYRLVNSTNNHTLSVSTYVNQLYNGETCKECRYDMFYMNSFTLDYLISHIYSLYGNAHNVNVTFIRIDIEGSELKALRGLKKSIKNNPWMIISLTSYTIPVYGAQTVRHTEIAMEMELLGYVPIDFIGRNQLQVQMESGIRIPMTVSHEIMWVPKKMVVFKKEHSRLKHDVYWSDQFVMKCDNESAER